ELLVVLSTASSRPSLVKSPTPMTVPGVPAAKFTLIGPPKVPSPLPRRSLIPVRVAKTRSGMPSPFTSATWRGKPAAKGTRRWKGAVAVARKQQGLRAAAGRHNEVLLAVVVDVARHRRVEAVEIPDGDPRLEGAVAVAPQQDHVVKFLGHHQVL